MSYAGATRFKPDTTADYAEFKAAAVGYIANLAKGDLRGLLEKPLDWNPGRIGYFMAMYQLLNGLQAVNLPTKSRIIEVGSGAGWATEILAALHFKVDCIEPSAEMIEVAKGRVLSHLKHHGIERLYRNVTWQCSTMEEGVVPSRQADAVLYFESFHHVINERAALEKTWRALKPGGWIIILGDANWIPGHPEQEAAWTAEMEAYGTLESPFTDGYLVWLLKQRGFSKVTRHHLVNGLIPVERDNEPVRNFAQINAAFINLVTAQKPLDGQPALPESPPAPEPESEPVVELEPEPVAELQPEPASVAAAHPPLSFRQKLAWKLHRLVDIVVG